MVRIFCGMFWSAENCPTRAMSPVIVSVSASYMSSVLKSRSPSPRAAAASRGMRARGEKYVKPLCTVHLDGPAVLGTAIVPTW